MRRLFLIALLAGCATPPPANEPEPAKAKESEPVPVGASIETLGLT